MSGATTKALTDLIYDRWGESGTGHELDNEQLWTLAREAAQTIESAGTTKAIIRAWLEQVGMSAFVLIAMGNNAEGYGMAVSAGNLRRWTEFVREVTGE